MLMKSKARHTVRKFSGLTALVEHYKSLGQNNGLQTALTHGVHVDGTLSSDDDSGSYGIYTNPQISL